MKHIVVATADPATARAILADLGPHAQVVRTCATWLETVLCLGAPDARLVLVDPALPGLQGPLLAELAGAVLTPMAVYALGGDVPGLARVDGEVALRRLAEQAVPRSLDPAETELLRLSGIGGDPIARAESLARGPEPVRLEGERGTGKEWVATILHRLSGRPGPLRTVDPTDAVLVRDDVPGTLWVEHVDRVPPARVRAFVDLAVTTGWKVVAGSRLPVDDRDGVPWRAVQLVPLRERPADIRPLTRLFLARWRGRLSLPRRQFHASLWQLMEQHPWPGNQRELETFVVQAATSARSTVLSLGTVPRAVLARLDPTATQVDDAVAFTEVVEERLRGIVARHAPGTEPGLYRMVMEATEAVLFRLAMQRTGGNQKAAAELLGIARNTLRARWTPPEGP